MTSHRPVITTFDKIGKQELHYVGALAANLGEITSARANVPEGFVITTEAFSRFLEENKIEEQISDTLKALNKSNPEEVQMVSNKLQQLILRSRIPKQVAEEIVESFKKLPKPFLKKRSVTVRSSELVEYNPVEIPHVTSEANLLESVKECWATLFSPSGLFYRLESGAEFSMGLVIQRDLAPKISGFAFTVDFIRGRKDSLVVSTKHEEYLIEKHTHRIIFKESLDDSKTKSIPEFVLTLVSKTSEDLQDYFYFPQEVSWVLEGSKLYIVNSSAITNYERLESKKKEANLTPEIIKVYKDEEPVANIRTATRIYLDYNLHEKIKKQSQLKSDGIRVNGDFLNGKDLSKTLAIFCRDFSPRPVIYQASDFEQNEGIMGFRGVKRLINRPEKFKKELKAISKVRRKYKNLWLQLPVARSSHEVKVARRMIYDEGLFSNSTFKLWLTISTPENVLSLKSYLDTQVNGISIGSDDLSMLILGEENVVYDSEALFWAYRHIIRLAAKRGILVSMHGGGVNYSEETVERIVKYGITSVSADKNVLNRVKRLVAEKERELMK